jgi:outer membrane protein OmpA-like peptidoglycan-associated protein/transcriptional regulator with XRE-family HTH domain
MGRPEKPVESASPYGSFAASLRELRGQSGLTYQQIARAASYGTSTMAAATRGDSLPSLPVTLAFVAACGGDENEWRVAWRKAHSRAESHSLVERPGGPQSPVTTSMADGLSSVSTLAELAAVLNRLRLAANLTLRQLSRRTGYSASTLSDLLNGRRTRLSWDTVAKVVVACYDSAGKSRADLQAWHAAWDRACRSADAQRWPPAGSGPRRTPARLCDPYEMSVHRAVSVGEDVSPPAYIERDLDRDLRQALATDQARSRFFLLIGASGTGKTRLAYEAVRAALPDFGVLLPTSAADLAAPPPPRTIVWLDDIDQHLNWANLTPLTMQAMLRAPGPVIILGTIWPERYHTYVALSASPAEDVYQRQREILNLANVIVVPSQLSAAELARAHATAQSDPRIAEALKATDSELFQTLTAGPHLALRWATADAYAESLMSVALDAQRAGLPGPLTVGQLREAAAAYLSPRQLAQAPSDWFERALAYATTQVPGGIAVLAPDSPGTDAGTAVGYRAADYLLQVRRAAADTAAARAAYASLDDPRTVAELLRALREAGANGAASTLAARAATHTSSDDSQDLDRVEEAAGPRTTAVLIPEGVSALLLADQAWVDELVACNFTGPRYRLLEEELAKYAIVVLESWFSGHRIASMVRDLDYNEFQELFRDSDNRLEVVLETVAEALPRFRRQLAAGSWRPKGGTSLATYFLGTCQVVLPTKIRKYQSQRKLRWQQLRERFIELSGVDSLFMAPGWRGEQRGRHDGNIVARRALKAAAAAVTIALITIVGIGGTGGTGAKGAAYERSTAFQEPRLYTNVLAAVTFSPGQHQLSKSASNDMRLLAALLETNRKVRVRINGYADSPGSSQGNLALALKRAEGVADYLGSLGIQARRLTVAGLGVAGDQPLLRRVVITLVPPGSAWRPIRGALAELRAVFRQHGPRRRMAVGGQDPRLPEGT